MNIGFFGDSYVAFEHHDTWGRQLLNELDCTPTVTGKGGTNQYYAIDQWQQQTTKFNIAVFTFTWHHRLYHTDFYWSEVCRAEAEARADDVSHLSDMVKAVKVYRENLYNDEQSKFCFDLMVKWCLELPDQYPDTKFIFLPNTESSRQTALQFFNQGILFNFAFESISNNELRSPGPIGQVNDTRPGHINQHNNTVMKDIVKHVIINYEDYRNQVYNLDYRKFDLATYPSYE